jgi:hypothetical protein
MYCRLHVIQISITEYVCTIVGCPCTVQYMHTETEQSWTHREHVVSIITVLTCGWLPTNIQLYLASWCTPYMQNK